MDSTSSSKIRPASASSRHGWERFVWVGATLAAAVWLWHCWAFFSTSSWNDIRLAPAVALHYGQAIYPGPSGPPNTWMYGPLPIWLLWPAGWSGSPAAALGVAATINGLITLGAIIAVCRFTPLPSGWDASPRLRWTAALLAIAIWPRAAWQFIQADNLAVACGLLANLLLMRRRSAAGDWLAALFATAALFCKQTSIAVPLAQLIWLWSSRGARASVAHAARLAAALLGWCLLTVTLEDPGALRLSLFQLPSALPWVQDLAARLRDVAPAMGVHLLLPAVAYIWIRRQRRSALTVLHLPWLSWAIAVPPGLAALLTYGGNLNSLQGLGLWLPAGLTATLAVAQRTRLRRNALWIGVGLAVGLVGLRLALVPVWVWGLNHPRYAQAQTIVETWPEQVWFPWHPLVTLYAEGKRYADEDGLAVRALAGRPIRRDVLREHLPPRFHAIALPAGTPHWSIAYELRPEVYTRHQHGEWGIDVWPASPPPDTP
ncbi:hypothetical protein [Actomonas aquatica]|uniref:Glycosyltransferase RgtA/B/C/D-like domain-containing protein n=1 Tax=Actomonas aquatica TaxID=2866162 RepID=A0ABZ1CCZ8_9BACT|nr:hypothetical protein [Opitutus sp. WL0086]WRQ89547.1 hypothetical protein K1X11_009010 [Opitutus sp. WL0086]